VRVGGDGAGFARQRDGAIGVAISGKRFTTDRLDLARQEIARRQRAIEAAGGECVHLTPRDLVAAGKFLGSIAHSAAGRRIEQRFPQKILELHLAETKSAAMRVGGHRVAAHALSADAQRNAGVAMGDGVGALHQHLDPGAADALDHVRRNLDRHVGVKADMARQHVGIETGLGHVAGDDGADVVGRDAGAVEHGARRLDAEIGRRDRGKRAVIVDERRTHAVQQPGIIPGRSDRAGFWRCAHMATPPPNLLARAAYQTERSRETTRRTTAPGMGRWSEAPRVRLIFCFAIHR
jgi:hypothetical protein